MDRRKPQTPDAGPEKIPLEAIVKYVAKERDKYKEKMEQVAEYAKSLEAQNARLVDANATLRKDNAALRKGFKQSEMYVSMKRRIERLGKQNRDLWAQLARQTMEERNGR